MARQALDRGKGCPRDRPKDARLRTAGGHRGPASEGRQGASARLHRADVLRRLPRDLKGWIERVFSLDFAFGLTPDGWRGDVGGRVPLLKHEKALIIQPTIFDERAYDAGLRAAITLLVDEFALRFPGIKRVDHEYFYAVYGADDAKCAAYLDRAYALGRDF